MLEQDRKGSLALYLKENPQIPLSRAVEVTCAVLTGLESYHHRQGLHLHISPGSVYLTEDGAEVSASGAGDFRQNLWYTAPEVRTQNLAAIGCGADLYSICAIFFRMAAGRQLREGEVIGACLMPTLSAMPVWMPRVSLPAARQTAKILRKGLHILPQKRYQTIDQLREDLNRLSEMIETSHLT